MRWEGQSNVLPLDTPTNGTQSNKTGTSSGLDASDHTNIASNGKTPAERLGTPSGQRIGGFTYDRIKMFMEVSKAALEVPTPERNNTVIKMEGEGAFKDIENYKQGVDMVLARLDTHKKKDIPA